MNSKTVEINGGRLYKKSGEDFPWQLKCSRFDFRVIHGCPEIRFFDPSARVYFDRGKDSASEIDIFNNGGLNASIDFVSINLPWRFGRSEFYDSWSWGPSIGVGIGSPAGDSEDGTEKATGAPVVLTSVGLFLEYKFAKEGPSFGFEIGRSVGFSSDESVMDNSDSATFVGIKIKVPTISPGE
ncbi:hypothetical protein AB833_26725 [Chromatiales bacterium (ex Bugula neritina AB1)]|nr:hypothetical protein AB833_26725 [Chromatiales bacterium (ex Bugula neritina AB1)]